MNKVGGRPAAYAFPLLASGTILLVIGMIICSVVIESSTVEGVWERISPEKGHVTTAPESAERPDTITSESAKEPIMIASESTKGPDIIVSELATAKKNVKDKLRAFLPWSKEDTKEMMRVFWLQRKHVVGDTSFDSFLNTAREHRPRILNSRRGDETAAPKAVGYSHDPSKDDDEKEERKATGRSFGTVLQYLTAIGVFTGLAGFVLQFEGFRGLSWSCSIAQLVAILVMTTLRAYVRRGVLKKPYTKAVPFDYEMDWLALKMGFNADYLDRNDDLESPKKENGVSKAEAKDGKTCSKWDVVCHPSSPAISGKLSVPIVKAGSEPPAQVKKTQRQVGKEQQGGVMPTTERETKRVTQNPAEPEPGTMELDAMHYAEKVVGIRRRLGQLTNWESPASELAISIAKSVEIVMNRFFGDFENNGTFTWPLKVKIAPKGKGKQISWTPSKLFFTAKKDPEEG
jgi:hypothetical protein